MWSQAAINIPHMAVAVSDEKLRNKPIWRSQMAGPCPSAVLRTSLLITSQRSFSTKKGYPVDMEEKTNMGSIISHRVSVTVYRFDSSQCITWQWLWWFVLSMLTLDVGYVSSFHGCQERNKRVSGVDKGWRGWLGSHSFFLIRVRFARTSLLPKCPNVKTQRVL